MKQQGLFTRFLTSPNPEFDHKVKKTMPGMAHFAGTGPEGTTCGQCLFRVGRRKVWRCEKFQRNGPPIKANLESCKYFEATKRITLPTNLPRRCEG